MPATAMERRSWARFGEVPEAQPLGAEQVGDRDPHVGEEQLGGVLAVEAELLEVPPALEARHPPLDHQQRHPGMALGGVGLTATITRSALIPLVMKVLEPLTT